MTTQECTAMGEMISGMMGQMMNGAMMGSGWTSGGELWLGMLALTLVVAIGLSIGLLLNRRSPGPTADDPREIVRRRFARAS
jgi:hypothetical protein